jgi:quinol monooxygenase YgiN
MSNIVYLVLELAIKPAELNNVKALMNEMVKATQDNEPNTLNYEWFISKDNKTCHLYERYADSAAVMMHLETFGQKFAKRFMAALEKTRFTVYGNPSDEVIKALSGFGPVFMSPIGGFSR